MPKWLSIILCSGFGLLLVASQADASCVSGVLGFQTELSPQAQLLSGISQIYGKNYSTSFWMRPMMERILKRIYLGERNPADIIHSEFARIGNNINPARRAPLENWLFHWIQNFLEESEKLQTRSARFRANLSEPRRVALTLAELSVTDEELAGVREVIYRGLTWGQKPLETSVLISDLGIERFDQFGETLDCLKTHDRLVSNWFRQLRTSGVSPNQTFLSDQIDNFVSELAHLSHKDLSPLVRNFVFEGMHQRLTFEATPGREPRYPDISELQLRLRQELTNLAYVRIELAFTKEEPAALSANQINWTDLDASNFGYPISFNGLLSEFATKFDFDVARDLSRSGLQIVLLGDKALRRGLWIPNSDGAADFLSYNPTTRKLVLTEGKGGLSYGGEAIDYALGQLESSLRHLRKWMNDDTLEPELEIALKKNRARLRPYSIDRDHYLRRQRVNRAEKIFKAGIPIHIREVP